ncbi:hypothetical protein EK904_003406, partial [Melospiza melodia maxima]
TTGRKLEILRAVTEIHRNFVICAPTGSGKTVMFELAITRLLMEAPLPWLNIKVVYMAPIKALCSQRFDDWKEKFGPIGLTCKELTGDTLMDDLFEIHHADIIITTPEKWDSMTRRWRDNSIVQLVRLFLIDEVHVIKDESRGATLEVVVSRMKTIQSSLWRHLEKHDTVPPLRFVAVSATIPNTQDIAEWLSDSKMPAVCLKIDEDQRPVKLRKIVLGFPCSDNQTEFKFDLTLNYKIASIIQTYSEQKPALVFCATRKGVQQAASVLAKDAKFLLSIEQKQRLQGFANSLKDSKLRVTTSTLAMGVNLPAHLVVIKSTMHYVGGVFQEYSETDILQMIGRAGRPQFDTTATAVIMTRCSTRERYVQLLNGADIIESSLHRHLVEHLNAEIVLHTVTDVSVALEWIRSTFLYIRALKNPAHYGFSSGLDKVGIEAKLQELCLKNLNDLSAFDLIRMDEANNFKPTETGRLMAWYYIAFDTVKQFFTMKGTETLNELITMISNCTEFVDVKLRTNEKKILNTLNKDKDKITIRFPMEGKIKTREMKQSVSGADFGKIHFMCLNNWKKLVGVSLSNAMVNAGLTSFKKIEDINARELELILNRHPPFGNQIKESVLHLPKYELEIEQLPKYSDTLAEILVTIKLTNYEQLQTKRTAPDFHYVTLVIGDADNQVIINHKIMDSVLLKTGNWMKKIEVKRAVKSEDISINLISSDYVGLDIQRAYTAFYLTPKPEGRKVVTNQKLKAESTLDKCYSSPQSLPAAKVDTGGRSKQEIAYKKFGNRECNHRCKNKDVCGHDCCKTGVPPKSQMNGDTNFSLYLADLRSRNSVSSIPPVKRLKMQMLNQAENVDLKQFVFTPKSLLPALPRSSNKLSSLSPSVDQEDNINTLEVSQKQLQSWNCGKSNKSRYCFSDALNVNFELRDDIWDDIDDEKLVFASNFVSRELEHGNICLRSPDECQPLCQYTSSKATNNISKDSCTVQDESRIHNSDVSMVNSTSKVNLSAQIRNTTLEVVVLSEECMCLILHMHMEQGIFLIDMYGLSKEGRLPCHHLAIISKCIPPPEPTLAEVLLQNDCLTLPRDTSLYIKRIVSKQNPSPSSVGCDVHVLPLPVWMVNIELTAEVVILSCCNFCSEESYTEGTCLPPVFWKGQTSPPLRGTEQCSGVKTPDAPKLGREGKSEILLAVLQRILDFGCGTEQALEVTGERDNWVLVLQLIVVITFCLLKPCEKLLPFLEWDDAQKETLTRDFRPYFFKKVIEEYNPQDAPHTSVF